MSNILYGNLKSEHMIFNETGLSETIISELYERVEKYAFGYQIIDDVKILYYADKCDDSGRWYISCVCDIEIEDFLAPADIFDVSFHTVEEFENKTRTGSYRLERYPIVYPTKEHITQMYHGLYETLKNDGKLIVRMSFDQGKDAFVRNAMNLLARFLYVLPAELSNKISFSVGEENTLDNLNISIVSCYPTKINDNDILVDITVPTKFVTSDQLVNYWAKCFDDDDFFYDDIETLFSDCVHISDISVLPYLYLYNFFKNINFQNYYLLRFKCKDTVDFEKLGKYVELDKFIEEERHRELSEILVIFQKVLEKKKISEEQRRLIEIKKLFILFQKMFEEKRVIEEQKKLEEIKKLEEQRNSENIFQLWLKCLDKYVGDMKEKYAHYSENFGFYEYENYIDFFANISKAAEYKCKKCCEAAGKKCDIGWSKLNWKAVFDDNLWKIVTKNESIEFNLPYINILNSRYSYNIYSGFLIYLSAIWDVNYIDEEQKKKSEKTILSNDWSYNHSCYGRKVGNILYYGTGNHKYSATYDYRSFLDITSLVCLYVFVDDITEGYSNFENLNKECIKYLMKKCFLGNSSLRNIALYHCSFLYSSIMGFFENFGHYKMKIDSDMIERAKKFDVANSMKWLIERFEPQSREIVYESTLRSFIKKTENVTFNFDIDKKMARLIKECSSRKMKNKY